MAALGGAAVLAVPSLSRAESPVSVSPALTLSVSLGQKVAFGLGLDRRRSARRAPDRRSGAGNESSSLPRAGCSILSGATDQRRQSSMPPPGSWACGEGGGALSSFFLSSDFSNLLCAAVAQSADHDEIA